MGFSWIPPIGSDVEDSIMDEIQNNLRTLYMTDLDIQPPAGTVIDYWPLNFDVGEGDEVDDTHMSRIKTAVDYANYMNYCRTHYADHRDTDNPSYDIGRDDTHDTSRLATHDSTKQTVHYTTRQTTHYTTRLYNHNTSHDDALHTSRRDTHNTSQDQNKNVTIKDAERSGDYSSYDSGYCGGYQAGVQSTQNYVDKYGDNSSQNDGSKCNTYTPVCSREDDPVFCVDHGPYICVEFPDPPWIPIPTPPIPVPPPRPTPPPPPPQPPPPIWTPLPPPPPTCYFEGVCWSDMGWTH